MEKIKLILADDQTLFLKGLRLLLEHDDDFEIIAEAHNGIELLDAIKNSLPDVILVDLKMPEMDGVEATKKIKAAYPNIKIILLSMYNDETLINHTMKIGANSYLLKNEEPETLKKAIKTVYNQGFYFTDHVSQALLKGIQQGQSTNAHNLTGQSIQLSAREKEVLNLICQEFTTNEIAQQLYISPRTVEGHRKNLLEKTGARNTAGLVRYALKNHLL